MGPARWLPLLFAVFFPSVARATECAPRSAVSPCIASEGAWLPAIPSRFVTVPDARPLASHALSVGLGYRARPIVLVAPSPDPEGRDIDVVRDAIDFTTGWALRATPWLELSLVAPVTLYQRGAGPEATTTQNPTPLRHTAVHDPRVGFGTPLPVPRAWERASHFAAKAELWLSLPWGDEDRFAGEAGAVVAPGIVLGARFGSVHLGSQLGARLRRSAQLSTARVGSELTTALGVSVDLLDDELLGVAAEAWLAPSLVEQPQADAVLLPAEWMASVRSAPLRDRAFSLQLGAGTALPLSSATRDGATDHFAGVRSPSFRGILLLGYRPRAVAGSDP